MSDPWQTALKLEQFVNNYIKKKNFSQAFASAAEVLETREGDCTEHAVLLAALCRALAYSPGGDRPSVYATTQEFGYHMWTEAYINKPPFPTNLRSVPERARVKAFRVLRHYLSGFPSMPR